jgi:hypothetical protein
MLNIFWSNGDLKCWTPVLANDSIHLELQQAIQIGRDLKKLLPDKEFGVSDQISDGWKWRSDHDAGRYQASACDECNGKVYEPGNHFVLYRVPRPSNPADMACTISGHEKCFHPSRSATDDLSQGAWATESVWEEWIESPAARAAGRLFIS